ncbi:trypsin-like peptidase domain-containing protein [Saccharothrix obliqua]|uniref:trypsin-like peptidase domain-containing protein n=1 Tax=Saccharothrix obliqua TaxID=2861747 RepID=UPI001C5EE7A8|nr:trypsin-like peptidase domain-containing protein [Saccharothrix obliqua]MBW4720394.1 serine protease [Saccharothrix obliqua]
MRGDGGVLGAGVLLDQEHVLTCAHVALNTDHLAVDMVGLPGAPASTADIVACVPPSGDDRGDVAVLRLRHRQPAGHGATLRKAALTWDRHVHTLGYPYGEGLDIGVWARMTLAAWAGSEWLQMNRRSDGEQRVRAGFSGSGVADDATGDVLGIVVSEYTDDDAGLAWMVPVAAIEAHLPLVSEWVVGDSGIDPIFTSADAAPPADRVRHVLDWLARRHEGAAVLIVAGEDLTDLRHAVALSSAGGAGEPDLALDVAGRTAEEVSRRIVDRAGLAVHGSSTERVREGTPPMTVVVDGVDQADQPRELFEDVFRPMVAGGARLVFGFRENDSAGLTAARALARDTVTARLDDFTTRVAALPPTGAGDLATRLKLLRGTVPADWAAVAEQLPRFERALARVEHGHRTARRLAAEVSDLRGLLEAWKARAGDGGLVEDIDTDAAYRVADALLSVVPVDLAAARAAVRRYQDVVRRALAEGGRR